MSRPWRQVKSWRGAPKRVNTEGYAGPNQQCPSFGITAAHMHALGGLASGTEAVECAIYGPSLLPCGLRQARRGDREVDSAIKAWGVLPSGLKATGRNRRVSATLSPILFLFFAPSGKLYLKVQQLLAEDEQAAGSPPPLLPHRRPGPKHPAYNIPASEWPTVLYCVLEKKEPPRKVAEEYGVSHETIRGIILAATKEPVQHESQLYNLS
jgi:hypothetical protein